MLLVGYVLTVVVLFIIALATVPSTGLVAVLFGLIMCGPLTLIDWKEK